MTDADRLGDLPTPQLILDEARMLRNIARLRSRLSLSLHVRVACRRRA
jgi:D-serine deaminase-like pyridoxal phosphate-dependent protein